METAALEYYATPGRFTTLDEGHPSSDQIETVVEMVQGLLIYDLMATPFYDVELTPEQEATIHERDSAAVLRAACAVDQRPLAQARPPRSRVGARCHLFSRLTVAMLRAAGVPARARCGFGTYFLPGRHEDHWVAEYWNPEIGGWQMVDAQLDATWRKMIGFGGDHLAITPSEFVTAPRAWQAWRRGELDADTCGLSAINEHGSFWIAGNLRLDLASLNKVEMLPWDVWGAGWEPGETPSDEMLALFDRVAENTVNPEVDIADVRRLYEGEALLRMDGTVLNVLHGTEERV